MERFTTAGFVATLLLIVGAAGCRNEPPTETAAEAPSTAPTAAATEPRGDAAITTAVQAKFYAEELTRGRLIDVSAENSIVTLRGTVPTETARQRAVELARGVEGVTSVTDQLQVGDNTTAAARAGEPSAATGTAGSDTAPADPAWLTTKIQAQYFADPEIKLSAIDVTTGGGGVVTLEGMVDSDEDKTKAVRIARETEGVTRVEDRLRVETSGAGGPAAVSTPTQPDPWITAKIQAKYFVDDDVKARTIDVTTHNGAVTLQGVVGSEAERRQAVAIARNTDGVREVTDQLRVDTAMARSDSRPPSGTGRDVVTVERPDPWITMKIQAQYFLDADVKGRQIDVDTRNGVVTLKGAVDNAQQKQEAEQIARETEGVKRVLNQLTVTTPVGK
jgi:osmotically-inducible protein OsmY